MANTITGGTVAVGGVDLVEYALCSVAQVRAELGLAETDVAEDDRISRAINDATDRIETVCNRRIVKRAANVTEYHDIADEDDAGQPVIWPREYPIESVSDVVSLSYGTYAARTAVDLSLLAADRGRRLVLLTGSLSEGTQANELVYRPGYTTAPHDIQGVAINLAQRLFWISKRTMAADESETAGGVTRKQIALAFSAEDQLVVDAYKRQDATSWKAKTAKFKAWVR